MSAEANEDQETRNKEGVLNVNGESFRRGQKRKKKESLGRKGSRGRKNFFIEVTGQQS